MFGNYANTSLGFKVAVISRDGSKLEKLKGFVSPGTKSNLITLVGNVGRYLLPLHLVFLINVIFASLDILRSDWFGMNCDYQAQRMEWRRWNRPCWSQWERSQMWCHLWALAGGREDHHTHSPLKNCTGWETHPHNLSMILFSDVYMATFLHSHFDLCICYSMLSNHCSNSSSLINRLLRLFFSAHLCPGKPFFPWWEMILTAPTHLSRVGPPKHLQSERLNLLWILNS